MRLFAYSLFFLFLGRFDSETAIMLPPSDPTPTYGLLVALHPDAEPHAVFGAGSLHYRSAQQPSYETLSVEDGYYLLHPTADIDHWRMRLKTHPAVRYAQWNHRIENRDQNPDDPFWEEQWNLDRIGLPQVWSFQPDNGVARSDAKKVWVGVLEKLGFDLNHNDLVNQFWINPEETPNDQVDNDHNGYIDDLKGWNFQKNQSIHITDSHGTKVAGLIAAHSNNQTGISGFTNQAGIIPLSGLHYEHQIVRAYLYLRDLRNKYNNSDGHEGAFVVAANASFGVNYGQPQDYPIWCEVFDKLGEVGILSVCSVMNAPVNIDQTGDIPTSCQSEYLVTVTESDYQDKMPGDTGFGPVSVDLAAPGRGSFTTFVNQRYGTVSRGTSFAAPQVSGTLALLYTSLCHDLLKTSRTEPAELAMKMKTWILEGAEQFPDFSNKVRSNGRLSAIGSFQIMQQNCPDLHSAIPTGRKVFPNPFSQEIIITHQVRSEGQYSFTLFNNQGQLIWQKRENMLPAVEVRTTLLLPRLNAGQYQLLIDGDHHQTVHRLIKINR